MQMRTIHDLPDELLIGIFSLIDDQTTFRNLCLTSKKIGQVALPFLYRIFTHRMFQKPKRLHCFLRSIINRPDLGKAVVEVQLKDPIKNDKFWDLNSWKQWAKMSYLPTLLSPDRHPFLNASNLLQGIDDSQRSIIIEQEEAQAALLLCLLTNIKRLTIENPVSAVSQPRFRMDHLTLSLLQPHIERGTALQKLSHLHATTNRLEGGQAGFRLSAVSGFFRLPELTKVTGVMCHEPEDADFIGFDCPPGTSSVRHIAFERSAICPAGHRLMLRACKCVQVFECDWAGIAVGWVELNFPLLREAVFDHRSNLKRVRLDVRRHFDSYWNSDDGLLPPLGPLDEFTSLTDLDVPASALIGWDEDGFGNYTALKDSLPPNLEHLRINQTAPRIYEQVAALADVCTVVYPRLMKITLCDDALSEELERHLKSRFEEVGAHVKLVIEDGGEIDHFN
jgi:F-box-like